MAEIDTPLKGGLGSMLRAWRSGIFETMRKMVLASQPAPGGHVGLIVKQTPVGWVAAVAV